MKCSMMSKQRPGRRCWGGVGCGGRGSEFEVIPLVLLVTGLHSECHWLNSAPAPHPSPPPSPLCHPIPSFVSEFKFQGEPYCLSLILWKLRLSLQTSLWSTLANQLGREARGRSHVHNLTFWSRKGSVGKDPLRRRWKWAGTQGYTQYRYLLSYEGSNRDY